MLQSLGRLDEAAEALTGALTSYQQLPADFAGQPDIRNGWAGTLVNIASICNKRREFERAKKYLAEALPHHEVALATNPRNEEYRTFFRNNLMASAGASAGLQDKSIAVQTVQKIRDLGWNRAGDAYFAACTLAYCIPIVAKDDRLDAANNRTAVQFYGDLAIAMLHDAVAKGFNNADHMMRNIDLDALRDREDFKKLLAELETKSKEPKAKQPKSK
jgi:hypothetical protein